MVIKKSASKISTPNLFLIPIFFNLFRLVSIWFLTQHEHNRRVTIDIHVHKQPWVMRSIICLYCTGAKEKPKDVTFRTFPKSVTVQEKESVEIECEILGKPTSGKYRNIIF